MKKYGIFCVFLLISTAGSHADAWDPADDVFMGATELEPPTFQIQTHGHHTFASSDGEDWFRVSLAKDTIYEFTIVPTDDTFKRLEIYEPAFSTVRILDDMGLTDMSTYTFIPKRDDIYYLRMRGNGGGYYLNYWNVPYTLPLLPFHRLP